MLSILEELPPAWHQQPSEPLLRTRTAGALYAQGFDKCHCVQADLGLKGNVREQKKEKEKKGRSS